MRKKIKEHELFTKLLFILFIGLFLQAIVISLFIYHRSRDAYIQLFNQSNDVVLKKIQSEFEGLNDAIENTLAAFDSNPAVESYFSNGPVQHMEQLQQLRTIQKMNDSLSKIHPMIDYDVLIFGENGRTFVGNDMLTAVSADSFFQSAIAQRVNERAADTQMLFVQYGLTLRDKKAPSVFFVKKLKNTLNHIYGYAVLSISSQQLANLFQSVVNPEISKISFMNEIASACEILGADVDQVRRAVGADRRIGPSFLFPGVGYGGSCFPKDVRAVVKFTGDRGYDFQILRAVELVNERQKSVLARKMEQHFGSLGGRTIAVWGLAFKPRTDDMREAPAIALIEQLLAAGAKVQAYDPAAMPAAKRIFGGRIVLAPRSYAALAGADALAVVTEWNEFRQPDFATMRRRMKSPVVFDGRNLYSRDVMRAHGFTYYAIGR